MYTNRELIRFLLQLPRDGKVSIVLPIVGDDPKIYAGDMVYEIKTCYAVGKDTSIYIEKGRYENALHTND
jgi:hypothetical protein